MKIAIGIIAISLALIVLMQSCAANIGGALGENKLLQADASLGIITALAFLVGGALSFKLPRVASVVFVLFGVLSLAVGAGAYTDLKVWGIVMISLAIIAFFTGIRKKV